MGVKIAIGAALAGAFILGASVVAYSSAQPEPAQSEPLLDVSTSFSDLQEEEIGQIIRAYLMEHPEVIIESVNEYSARERLAEQMRAKDNAVKNLPVMLNPKNGFIAGKNPAKAKVAVIEMVDYHCTFCKRAAGLVKELTEMDEDIKVVFRELPLLREESDYAAEMALAARDQGKFLEMHFAMMEASGILTKERIHAIAKSQGLNVAKMDKAVMGKAVPAAILETHDIAAQMGIDGTPAFIIAAIDGSYLEIVNGYRPEELVAKIEAAKKAVK